MASLAETVKSLRRDPDKVRQQLESFERSVDAFFAERERPLDAYENQWVAVFDGKVVANAPTLDGDIKMLKKQGVPPEAAFIQRDVLEPDERDAFRPIGSSEAPPGARNAAPGRRPGPTAKRIS